MPKVNFRYCLKCGELVPTYQEWGMTTHYNKEGEFIYTCLGPFAESEPPSLEEDWQDHLIAPCQDEFLLFVVSSTQLQNQTFDHDFIEKYNLQIIS